MKRNATNIFSTPYTRKDFTARMGIRFPRGKPRMIAPEPRL